MIQLVASRVCMQLRRATFGNWIRDLRCPIVGGGINGAASRRRCPARARGGADRPARLRQFHQQQSSNLVGAASNTWKTTITRWFVVVSATQPVAPQLPFAGSGDSFFASIDTGFHFHPLFLWAGAWLYWLFGNGFTQTPRLLSKRTIRREEPVVKTQDTVGGFEYSDAYLPDNDARFVFQFVRSAMDRGGVAANYVESLGARREGEIWIARARDVIDGGEMEIRARVLINAAGPFVDDHNALTGEQTEHRHVFSKGIHLIVPRITPQSTHLTFFADDGRLFFVIPMVRVPASVPPIPPWRRRSPR